MPKFSWNNFLIFLLQVIAIGGFVISIVHLNFQKSRLQKDLDALQLQRDSIQVRFDSLKNARPIHEKTINDAKTILNNTNAVDFFELPIMPE